LKIKLLILNTGKINTFTYKNIRNTKDKNKLNNMKLSNKEIKIEHINAKLKNYKKNYN
jgi:hypothetical protein